MHRFLLSIRRSFLQPVWAPLQRCLPLLALLKCYQEEGDLLPQSGEEDQEGNLLHSGDEEEEGDLLPQSGEEDQEGDLLHSGDEDGEGIPPSQGNEQVVLCDLQSPINDTLENNLGIDSPKSTGVDVKHAVVFTEANAWLASLCAPVEASHLAHRHGHFLKMFEADAVLMLSLLMARTFVFDPGGLTCLHEEALSACQHNAMTSHRRSSFAIAHAHLSAVGGAAKFKVKKFADIFVQAHIPAPKGLYTIGCGDQIGYTANYVHHDYMQRGTYNSTLNNESWQKKVPQDASHLLDCSLWLNSSNCKEGADAYFLIPLRGSISVQWNDEDFDEDDVARKMKTKRRMAVLRLLYLMKDLLDPG